MPLQAAHAGPLICAIIRTSPVIYAEFTTAMYLLTKACAEEAVFFSQWRRSVLLDEVMVEVGVTVGVAIAVTTGAGA